MPPPNIHHRKEYLAGGERLPDYRLTFLHNGTRALDEPAGFTYERPKGKGHTGMRRTVAPTVPDRGRI